jgi:hypothetical protein
MPENARHQRSQRVAGELCPELRPPELIARGRVAAVLRKRAAQRYDPLFAFGQVGH